MTDQLDRYRFNLTIRNDDYSTTFDNKAISFTVNQNQPIIEKPEDFYLAVTRFDIPADNLPLDIIVIQPNQANPNLTPYSVTLAWLDGSAVMHYYQEYLTYYAFNNYPSPATAVPIQVKSKYYWMYTFSQIITMFNTAFENAYSAMWAVHSVEMTALGLTTSDAPYFIYSYETKLLSLIVKKIYYLPSERLFVGYNSCSLKYLDNFMVDYTIGETHGMEFTFILPYYDNYDYRVDPTALTYDYIYCTQEYDTSQKIFAIDKIIFTSNSVPVHKESFAVAGEYKEVDKVSILTDFSPILDNLGDERSVLSYFPQGPLRLIDLFGSSPLYSIDLQIFWVDRFGHVWPLELTFASIATVKLEFIRKGTEN
jgi:hypothetical protein